MSISRVPVIPPDPQGAVKPKFFQEALGFTTENSGALAKLIVFDAKTAVSEGVTKFGERFAQMIKIAGANGKEATIKVIWIKTKDGNVSMVTAMPRR